MVRGIRIEMQRGPARLADVGAFLAQTVRIELHLPARTCVDVEKRRKKKPAAVILTGRVRLMLSVPQHAMLFMPANQSPY